MGGRRGKADERARLHGGNHGLDSAEVLADQRRRLLVGALETFAIRGYAAATITDLTRAASVSRRVFYANFADKDECFLATMEFAMAELRDVAAAGAGSEAEWARRVHGALAAVLARLEAEPELAWFLAVEAPAAGGEIADRLEAELTAFAPAFGWPSGTVPAGAETTAELALGGAVALLGTHVAEHDTVGITTLLPSLLEQFLTPFLGAAEAARLASELR